MGSLTDALVKDIPPARCMVATGLDAVCEDDDDHDTAATVPASRLASYLTEAGCPVSASSIRTHRRGECRCG